MKMSEKVVKLEINIESLPISSLFKAVIGKEINTTETPVNWGAQSVADLRYLYELTETQAYKLRCAFELVTRLNNKPKRIESLTSFEAAEIYFKKLKKSNKEMFMMVALDNENHVIGEKLIGLGTENTCVVDIKDIIRTTLALGANGLIVAHNHPSGNTTPSREDLLTTQQIIKACEVMKIRFLDHLILGRYDDTYSFARAEML